MLGSDILPGHDRFTASYCCVADRTPRKRALSVGFIVSHLLPAINRFRPVSSIFQRTRTLTNLMLAAIMLLSFRKETHPCESTWLT